MRTKAVFKIQSICNSHGIRIYPIPKYGEYMLVIETNKSPDWAPRYVTSLIQGKLRFSTKTTEWVDKVDELYKELYETKVLPKLAAKPSKGDLK